MTKIRNNKQLLKHLEFTPEDARFDSKQLFQEHFFNFQFEDQYGFGNHPNKGLIRKRIVQLLFEIHDSWKVELEKLNTPYYLAIWLCEPQIIRSEVVCAIDERIEMYSTNWFDPSEKAPFILSESYGKNRDQLNRFNWERKNSYDTHEATDFVQSNYKNQKQFHSDQRAFNRIKKISTKVMDTAYGETYYERIGDIWVGREK